MHFYHQFNDLDISGIYDYEPLLPCFDFPSDMRDQQVLDLGCGSGYFARHFESKGAQVIACDVNIGAADYIKKRLNLKMKILEGDVFDLDFGREFDFVFCGSLLLHAFYPMWLLKLAHKNLKPSGTFMLTTSYMEGKEMIVRCNPYSKTIPPGGMPGEASMDPPLWQPTISAVKNMVSLAGFENPQCVKKFLLSPTPYGRQQGWNDESPHCIVKSYKDGDPWGLNQGW